MTTKGPKGNMTRPLTTPYDVGDIVRLTTVQDETIWRGKNRAWAPRVGDTGVIRKVIISDPEDGDDTILMFWVKFSEWGRTTLVGEPEFALVAKNETELPAAGATSADEAWLRQQLDGLGRSGV